jgi:hypothetical protein
MPTSIALLNDGTVVTWGGTIGGLVDQPPGLSDVTAVLANNLALKSGGAVVMWRQGFGKAVDLPNDWADIRAIGLGPWEPVLLRRDDKILIQNRWVGLKTPPDLSDVRAVAESAGAGHALLEDGRLVEWGVYGTDP